MKDSKTYENFQNIYWVLKHMRGSKKIERFQTIERFKYICMVIKKLGRLKKNAMVSKNLKLFKTFARF
jgi:hypothetical protein